MGLRRTRIHFYRSVRAALLSTNKRTDNSIITACNIARPLADDKGTTISVERISKKGCLRKARTLQNGKSGKQTRYVKFNKIY